MMLSFDQEGALPAKESVDSCKVNTAEKAHFDRNIGLFHQIAADFALLIGTTSFSTINDANLGCLVDSTNFAHRTIAQLARCWQHVQHAQAA